jgi:hypothetical protein
MVSSRMARLWAASAESLAKPWAETTVWGMGALPVVWYLQVIDQTGKTIEIDHEWHLTCKYRFKLIGSKINYTNDIKF